MNSITHLFEKAEKENLWFYQPYIRQWFSPKELRDCQEKGQYQWGETNWQLRDPKIRRERLKEAVEEARQKLLDFEKKMDHNPEKIIFKSSPPFCPECGDTIAFVCDNDDCENSTGLHRA